MKINLSEQLSSKYLDARELLAQDFFIELPEDNVDLSAYLIPNTYCLVIINGHVNLSLSSLPENLFKINSNGGSFQIGANQKVNQPVHVINVHKNMNRPSWQELSFFIDLDNQSELTLLEEYVSLDGGVYLNSITTEITLGKQAILHYYKLQRDSLQSYHLAKTMVSQQANSSFHYVMVSNGAKLNRDDLFVEHRELGSFAELNGLFRACSDQQVMQHTRADHFGVGCTTRQHYRGLASDQARGIFDGQMIVHPGAMKSSVHQANHNLLLSNSAEIDTQPVLEIYVDEVSASHGATIGQLDEEALFYCQSRGISMEEAKRLLVFGFINALFDDIASNAISDYVKRAVIGDL